MSGRPVCLIRTTRTKWATQWRSSAGATTRPLVISWFFFHFISLGFSLMIWNRALYNISRQRTEYRPAPDPDVRHLLCRNQRPVPATVGCGSLFGGQGDLRRRVDGPPLLLRRRRWSDELLQPQLGHFHGGGRGLDGRQQRRLPEFQVA